jgi:hypothetical protein
MGPETKNDCAGEGQQQISALPRTLSSESGVGTRSRWLPVSTEPQESPMLEAATKQQLVKTVN